MWRAVTLRFVCVWVAHTRVLGYACVALGCAQVCMQDMIRAQFKMKCEKKNGTCRVYYPLAVVCCFDVFICNLYVTCMYVAFLSPFVPLCILMLLVCTGMLLLCTRVSLAGTLCVVTTCLRSQRRNFDNQMSEMNFSVRDFDKVHFASMGILANSIYCLCT